MCVYLGLRLQFISRTQYSNLILVLNRIEHYVSEKFSNLQKITQPEQSKSRRKSPRTLSPHLYRKSLKTQESAWQVEEPRGFTCQQPELWFAFFSSWENCADPGGNELSQASKPQCREPASQQPDLSKKEPYQKLDKQAPACLSEDSQRKHFLYFIRFN